MPKDKSNRFSKSSKSEKIHAGHRKRLKQKFLKDGSFENFEPHEIIEMLLFYAIPRANTNELAHMLLRDYRTVGNICSQHPYSLSGKYEAISEHTAVLLSMVSHIMALIQKQESDSKFVFATKNDCFKYIKYIQPLFSDKAYECLYVILLNNNHQIVGETLLEKGTVNKVSISARKIVQEIVKFRAANIILAHNHPSGVAQPSASDVAFTRELFLGLKFIDVELLDHVIVTNKEYVSFRKVGYLDRENDNWRIII